MPSNWQTFDGSKALPPGLTDVVEQAGEIAGKVADFLDAVVTALDIVKAVAQGGLDLYTTVVSGFIDLAEDFIKDIKAANIYVLVDYPQNINAGLFNPVSQVNLAGTVFDTSGFAVAASSDPNNRKTPGDRRPQENTLQAVARRRVSWNPPSKDFLSYDEAINRIAFAFDDPEDANRPLFSDNAATFGVLFMVHSTEVASFLKLVRSISNLFAVEDLQQLAWPGIADFVEGVTKPLDELTQKELELLDLQIPIELRNGGKHPNFVMKTSLLDLIPALKDVLDLLLQLLDAVRPNGDLTNFVQEVIDAFARKIARLREIAQRIRELSEELKAAFAGTAVSFVAISSNTGNAGFRAGLYASTGHPEFEEALVCSLLLYGGGPGLAGFKLFFENAGGGAAVIDSVENAIESAAQHVTRPLVRP